MPDTFELGDGILFMKVGVHANESLADIIRRKREEIDQAGYAMWGYGGNTCHPRTMVQPFAAAHATDTRPIRLCMKEIDSRHFADPVRAEEYSIDGVKWEAVPSAINVLGSRYALCIKELHEADTTLSLAETTVAVGNSKGRPGDVYINGHVDKACLEVVSDGGDDRPVQIGLVAELVAPYAVFLKN
jgi:hypothetical protein